MDIDTWRLLQENGTLLVFSGMIQKVQEAVFPLDWKHIITTALVGVSAAIMGSYVKVERIEERISQISTARSAQVAKLEQECKEDITDMKTYVMERETATRSELVLVRESLASVREALSVLNKHMGK